MIVTRRGALAALLGLPALAVPDAASALVPGAARPDPGPAPIIEANNGWNRVARRTTKRAVRHTVRQSTRPPRRGYPPPY